MEQSVSIQLNHYTETKLCDYINKAIKIRDALIEVDDGEQTSTYFKFPLPPPSCMISPVSLHNQDKIYKTSIIWFSIITTSFICYQRIFIPLQMSPTYLLILLEGVPYLLMNNYSLMLVSLCGRLSSPKMASAVYFIPYADKIWHLHTFYWILGARPLPFSMEDFMMETMLCDFPGWFIKMHTLSPCLFEQCTLGA